MICLLDLEVLLRRRLDHYLSDAIVQHFMDLRGRVAALEARTQAEPPKPEREPGWYAVHFRGSSTPWVSWWDGQCWRRGGPVGEADFRAHEIDWIGPRLDLPAEKVTP